MDSLKEIFEAMGQRIRSPFWGYVFLSFVFINWKALYFVVFEDVGSTMKFRFFELTTNPLSLYVFPLVAGLLATLSSPYISEWMSRWAEKPINRRRIREVDAAHKVLEVKNRFAAERERERAIFEQSLIAAAKIDEQVEEIQDEQKRNEIADQIQSNRENAPKVAPKDLLGGVQDEQKDKSFEGVNIRNRLEILEQRMKNNADRIKNFNNMAEHERANEMLNQNVQLLEEKEHLLISLERMG